MGMPPGSSAQRLHDDGADEPARGQVNRRATARPPVHLHTMATRTAPRQARSARSLDLILDAAEQLMQQRGVVETSTVDVAAAAGLWRGG